MCSLSMLIACERRIYGLTLHLETLIFELFMRIVVLLGAALNFLIGIGHLVCMFYLDAIFKIYGIDDFMDRFTAVNPVLPYVITAIIAMAFFVAGLYGIASLGIVNCHLPLQRIAVWVIVVVYFCRALYGVLVLFDEFTWLEMSSVTVSLVLSVCYMPLLFCRKNKKLTLN